MLQFPTLFWKQKSLLDVQKAERKQSWKSLDSWVPLGLFGAKTWPTFRGTYKSLAKSKQRTKEQNLDLEVENRSYFFLIPVIILSAQSFAVKLHETSQI